MNESAIPVAVLASAVALLGAALTLASCGADSASPPSPGGVAGAPYGAGAAASGGLASNTPSDGGPGSGVDGGGAEAGAAPTNANPTGVTATHAGEFLGSIGACTHVGQGVDSATDAATALAFAGIRNIRDDGHPEHVADWIAMHKTANVRVCLLTDHDVASTVGMAKDLQAAGALLAVEGANEPNNFAVSYGGETSSFTGSFHAVAALQRDLYAAVKAEPTLAGIPVFHSSEAGGSEPDNVGLQFLTIPAGAGTTMPDGTKYADYANTHNYVCGHSHDLVDNVAWNASDPTLNGDWDGPFVEYGHTWHGGFAGYSNADLSSLPRVTTETGWVTTGDGAITQDQQGKVLLNLYLSAFKRGWTNTFVYMLRDEPGQGDWGFFDQNYQPKKSGTYLHNFTTILADTSSAPAAAPAAPSKLDYAIAAPPATLHDLLFEKNGAFDLVIWSERLTGGSDAITLDLKRSRDTVDVFDPTVGTTSTKTLHAVSSVPLTLTDHPLIIELR